MNQFLTLIILYPLLLTGCNTSVNKEQNKTIDIAVTSKPNVLLISVDDLKDWVGFLGGYEGTVYTPNMDKLASEGVAFTNAHTAASVCCPSRNALMLGKRPSTTGLYNNNQWWKAAYPNEVPLPQYFKENGYYVAGSGKNFHHTPGNNPPIVWDEYKDQVFDNPWRHSSWSPERYFVHYGFRGPIQERPSWKPLNGIPKSRGELDWGPIPELKNENYGDIIAVNFVQEFLKRDIEKPFFLAAGIYRPHLPWYVPQKYFDMYPLDEIILPKLNKNDLDDVPDAGKKLALANKDYSIIKEDGKLKEAVQAYLASISFADDQVGKIMKALNNSKFADNTIVVLWSDHGWHLGTKEHWHKQTLWEECTRIPFIIKAPGATGNGMKCDKPIDMTSVFPTLISQCKLPSRNDLDGHDISQLLVDPKSDWKYPALTEIKNGNMAVRTENWRYIKYWDRTEELYNVKKDPFEWDNLAGNIEYAKIKEKHAKWIPEKFADAVPGKEAYYFDPYRYTYLNRKTGEFIDGKN